MGYISNGEANDYIMKEFGIPSVSPELANDDFFSTEFFLPYSFVTKSVLRDNHKWILHTFKKMTGELSVDPLGNATYFYDGSNKIGFKVDIKNTGL